MNKITGYRIMAGYTQLQMAKKLSITEGTYRRKEKGLSSFRDYEMELFFNEIQSALPDITITDIFFNLKPTQKDEVKEVKENA